MLWCSVKALWVGRNTSGDNEHPIHSHRAKCSWLLYTDRTVMCSITQAPPFSTILAEYRYIRHSYLIKSLLTKLNWWMNYGWVGDTILSTLQASFLPERERGPISAVLHLRRVGQNGPCAFLQKHMSESNADYWWSCASTVTLGRWNCGKIVHLSSHHSWIGTKLFISPLLTHAYFPKS